MIQPRPYKDINEMKDFNKWINRLHREHKKVRKQLGSTSHIDSRNEF